MPPHFSPYEKYGSPHQIQLTVTSYVGGNLAIQMVAWEDGYPEPWASLTVNLDGKRQKDCAFIDTNGDPDFPVWLIRNGLAIPTGVLQRSGFCEYPEYRFRADRLQELDPNGYASYLASQQSGKKRINNNDDETASPILYFGVSLTTQRPVGCFLQPTGFA